MQHINHTHTGVRPLPTIQSDAIFYPLKNLNGTVVLQPDEYITLDVGYGMLIVTNTTNGWCNVSILCSLDVVQALSQHNGGILIEKASEHKTKIINMHNKDLVLGYLFLGDLYT